MKNEEYARELGNKLLKIPYGLVYYIEHDLDDYNPKHTKPRYIDTLELYDGKLLKRTWAYRKTKNVIEYQEIVRKMHGLDYTIAGSIYSYFSGRNVYFELGGWNRYYLTNKNSYEFNAPILHDCIQLIDELYPYNSYHLYDNKTPGIYLGWFDYIEKYAKFPQIELLVKRGYGFLVKDANFLNMKEKQIEKITGVPNQFIDYCRYYSVKTIRTICNKYKPKDNDEMDFILSLNGHPRVKKYYRSRMINYVNKRNIEYYDDYLRMAEQLGYDLKKSSVLFPDDISAAHDKAMNELTVLKNKFKEEGIQKRLEVLEKNTYENQLYGVVIPQNSEDFINESKELNHCVKSYIDSHIKGETNVYFIRNKNSIEKPFVTVEVKSNKLTQYRAKNNKAPDEDVAAFIKEWCKNKRIECTI